MFVVRSAENRTAKPGPFREMATIGFAMLRADQAAKGGMEVGDMTKVIAIRKDVLMGIDRIRSWQATKLMENHITQARIMESLGRVDRNRARVLESSARKNKEEPASNRLRERAFRSFAAGAKHRVEASKMSASLPMGRDLANNLIEVALTDYREAANTLSCFPSKGGLSVKEVMVEASEAISIARGSGLAEAANLTQRRFDRALGI